jgi:hypothetical protein
MCDCYYHPCKVCRRKIPVHLGDFNTDRGEIEVYCWKHLRAIPKGYPAVFFTFGDLEEEKKREFRVLYKGEKHLIGKTVAFVPLTKNAYKWTIEEENCNTPNTIIPYKRKVRR